MSFFETPPAPCTERGGGIAMRIEPKEADLGDFSVRRVLPARKQRSVGPFVFFDHMGPAEFPPARGIAVLPHPHIGLATITYLFEGEIIHRDSLGKVQPITPGAVNLMVAGRGIVHSERAGADLARSAVLHGIQSWIALPAEHEEMAPAFHHYPVDKVPELLLEGAVVRVIMGQAFDACSPVESFSRTLYLDVSMHKGAELALPEEEEELAFYVVSGAVEVAGEHVEHGVMALACKGRALTIRARADSRIMVVGGAAIGPRKMYWNFVSTRSERIERAKRDWREQRFDPVPGDSDYVPLPE